MKPTKVSNFKLGDYQGQKKCHFAIWESNQHEQNECNDYMSPVSMENDIKHAYEERQAKTKDTMKINLN